MSNGNIGLQHIEARKRWFKRLEKFPHPDAFKGFLDRLIYVFGFAGIVFLIPQITKIWIGKNAAGVSVIAWASYFVGALFWVVYGIAHKSKPIIISYSLGAIVDILVVMGTIIYG